MASPRVIDRRFLLLAGAMFACAGDAVAQTANRPSGSVEVTTDHRRRGLSWSEGKVAADAIVTLPLSTALRIEGRVTTLRGSARHGGADVGLDATAAYSRDFGGFSLTGGATGHVFAGGVGGLHYGEVDAGAGFAIGPAQLDVEAHYAPSQSGIGGDNLYLAARASAGIPTTPYTVAAHVGRTTGGTDDPLRAARLRPGGDYTDWGVRVERVTGNLAIGLRYSGTDIDRRAIAASPYADLSNAGDRLTGHVAIFL